jgi:hypothetical protein
LQNVSNLFESARRLEINFIEFYSNQRRWEGNNFLHVSMIQVYNVLTYYKDHLGYYNHPNITTQFHSLFWYLLIY